MEKMLETVKYHKTELIGHLIAFTLMLVVIFGTTSDTMRDGFISLAKATSLTTVQIILIGWYIVMALMTAGLGFRLFQTLCYMSEDYQKRLQK